MKRVWQKACGPATAWSRRGYRLALAEFRVVRASLPRIGVITAAARVMLAEMDRLGLEPSSRVLLSGKKEKLPPRRFLRRELRQNVRRAR